MGSRYLESAREEKTVYKKILVPLDGSPVAEQILPYARSLAKTLDVPVELFEAVEPERVALHSGAKQSQEVDIVKTRLKGEALGYLKKVEESFAKSSKISSSVEIGTPADMIGAKAGAQAGTLIAMATHGRSGVQRWLLGSVAEKVIQSATSHIFLVRANEPKAVEASLKTVIVPLDGSPLAEEVLPYVSDMAKKMDLEVLLVRVFTLPVLLYGGEDYYATDLTEILEVAKNEAKRYLEEKVARLKIVEGLNRVSSIYLEGESAGQIVDLARKTPDNFIAMSTHGRSGVGRLVLGSVTSRVVRHSGDPVLVVRASAKAQA